MLLPRILTAILGIPVVLICIYYGSMLFLLLLFIILLYMLHEFAYMVNSVGYEVHKVVVYLVGIITFFSIIFEPLQFNKNSLLLTSINFTLILFILFLIEIIKQKPLGSVGRISVEFTVPMLLGWSLAHLFLIRDIKNYGMKLTFILFLTIWIIDNAAYLFGVVFGKKKLASVVSPKKTIAGFIFGYIFGILGFLFLFRVFFIDRVFNFRDLIIISVILPFVCMLSDLAESLIKRDCGFKDSDNLLVGHGGMLDRFDSFIFTSPVFYYFLRIVLNR
jgi:phosphatidate cytidylyltransferase